ncbi:RHS repeat domain-containing protein [Chryseobacterium sp. CT-SW4]|uniref:hypothetical protein n=1 Tax=Chryseobacterium sp. SW-1 TaxID=3157343 RepID=UPI003B02A076
MKKYIFSIFLLYAGVVNAQNNLMPEPTTGSVQSYVNAAISPATGIPNIGFPIYQLGTTNKNYSVSLGLSYHAYNAKPNVPASEVGLGWSMLSAGVINRQVEGGYVDELKNWTDITKEEADTFYYYIPGFSGKFKIHKNPNSDNLMISNLTGEKVKIEYVRSTATTKLIISSFKITDDKGFEYHFQDSNLGLVKDGVTDTNYKTSFVLGKILDPNGIEVASYIYDKKIKYKGASTIIQSQVYKPNTLSTAKGKIKFEYTYTSAYDQAEYYHNDPYALDKISLLNNAGTILSQYKFEYGLVGVRSEVIDSFGMTIEMDTSKRTLSKIKKLNKNLAIDEETKYEYDEAGSETSYGVAGNLTGNYLCPADTPIEYPATYTKGLLKKITFPTKGYVIYNFEANEIYEDQSGVDYSQPAIVISNPRYQYYVQTEIPYDTNTTRTYQFQVSGTAGVKYPIYFNWEMGDDYMETDIHGNFIFLQYTVKNAAGTVVSASTSACSSPALYKLTPGTYTITITKGGGNGFYRIYQIKGITGSYKNSIPVKTGARVNKIRSYDADGTLVKTKEFDYLSFDNSYSSSGYSFTSYGDCSPSSYGGIILYRNVKETEIAGNDNNGYTKYYFKNPDDYRNPATNYYSYYNITSGGILEKQETYNKQDQIVESSSFEYTMQENPNTTETQLCGINSKVSWIAKIKETSKTYLNQSPYQTISETTFSPDNFQESLSKTTAQDGSVSEVTTRYASDLGNTRLVNANMISVPLQVESKTDGTFISKVTTKYDNTSHFYPTSIESTNLNQVAETQTTFDVYDSKGNLVQATDKAGNSVTTIWGYYQTLPIAQIVGAKYSDISSLSVVTAAVNASNADADNPANEAALLTALENLRLSSALQGYPVSVYTYDPLIGITNSVSDNGMKLTYEYDDSGRLLKVKNSSGQVIKENKYNYKQ